ncbi:MAG: cytochrome ubiquinol oxidase subunit I [Nitrospinae bacterium]|nr:cytochrome ubiquinol oxidase subunit I [Nitrospinota bacterium]
MAPAGETAIAPVGQPAPVLTEESYPLLGGGSSRVKVWIVAQLHLFFAAFVLGVPIFVLVIEGIGMATGDKRYDAMAKEFIKISMVAFSFTATLGGILLFLLAMLYPDFTVYSLKIFRPILIAYALLFFGESLCLYIYYYGWEAMSSGFGKWVHLTVGLLLNAAGMTLMVLSNSWATFMMAPSGVTPDGAFLGDVWAVMHGPLWNPINLHRFIANIAYGGSIVGAYAAYKFLTAKAPEEKAHYDWMGYTANFIAVVGLLPLPFAGYWLTKELYAYSQQMGITLMGGIFAWLFIIQALLIGAIFLGANYYLWLGLVRVPGGEAYRKAIGWMATVLLVCFLVWFTPHTIIMTSSEIKALGGAHHPVLGALGVMSAKNTAVNIMILTTFLAFLLYQRAGKIPKVGWARGGNAALAALFAAGAANIVTLGIYGYYIPANIRIGLSVPQVFTTLFVIAAASLINGVMYRGASETGPTRWGDMPARSQYALFLLAVSFTWLMGLMGYVRSGIRQHWHVYTVFRDYSPDAFTPTLGYAANVVSVTVLIFMAMVIFIFWLDNFSRKKAAHK